MTQEEVMEETICEGIDDYSMENATQEEEINENKNEMNDLSQNPETTNIDGNEEEVGNVPLETDTNKSVGQTGRETESESETVSTEVEANDDDESLPRSQRSRKPTEKKAELEKNREKRCPSKVSKQRILIFPQSAKAQ